jgi:hypothetical protein
VGCSPRRAPTNECGLVFVSLTELFLLPGVGLRFGAIFLSQLPGRAEAGLMFALPPQSLSERAADALIETGLLTDEHHHILGRIA